MKTPSFRTISLAGLSVGLALFASSVSAADIVALCIGNDNYHQPDDRLDTPVADAKLMKAALEGLPWSADVELLEDATREQTVIALNRLPQRARGARLVMVFYSGHGLEGRPAGFAKTDTFLLPVEAEIPSVDHLPTRAVGLGQILDKLKDCPVTARAVILDCCRDGAPRATKSLAGASKSFGNIDEQVKRALGEAVVPEATLIAFSTSPGRKAAAFLNRNDRHSPFTKFLAERLNNGEGNLRDLVEEAGEKTARATGRRQVPYVAYSGASSAIRRIVFRGPIRNDAGTSGSEERFPGSNHETRLPRVSETLRARPVPGDPLSVTLPPPFDRIGNISIERIEDGNRTGRPFSSGTSLQIPHPDIEGAVIPFSVLSTDGEQAMAVPRVGTALPEEEQNKVWRGNVPWNESEEIKVGGYRFEVSFKATSRRRVGGLPDQTDYETFRELYFKSQEGGELAVLKYNNGQGLLRSGGTLREEFSYRGRKFQASLTVEKGLFKKTTFTGELKLLD